MTAQETHNANWFETTLDSQMGPTDLTATVVSTSDGPPSPCYLVIEPNDPAQREVILFDGTFTSTAFVTSDIGNRYLAGSATDSGLTHPVGSVVQSRPLAQHDEDIHDRVDAKIDKTAADATYVAQGAQTSSVLTTESTTSTTYTALTTIGPVVNVTVPDSGKIAVVTSAMLWTDTAGAAANMDFNLADANTRSATNDTRLRHTSSVANHSAQKAQVTILTGLTPGATSVTARYSVSGSATASFANRHVSAFPL